MLIIGMLHHRKDPGKVIKSYAYAAVAQAEGADLLYFSPKGVDLEKRKINGYIYRNGDWRKVESPFPDVIYNAGSPEKLSKASEIIDKLKKFIPFTTNSIGNKMRVHQRLLEAGEFKDYLIPSEVISTLSQFFNFMNSYRKIVFKPVNGHKGQGVTYIWTIGNEYGVLEGSEKKIVSRDQLSAFVSQNIRNEHYIVQPFINCRTKDGFAYDIRSHIQKNGSGQWVITAIYPRIATGESIVTNISSGGVTKYLVPFLKEEFGCEFYDIKRYLEVFSLNLASHLDMLQHQYFNESIDELGIDIGLDDMRKIWIYEVNWRPGCPPAFYLEQDVVRNMIQYAIYLAQKR